MSPSSGRRRPLVRPAVQPHLEILHTVAATVSRTLDVDDVLRTAVEALTRVTGHEIASLHLLSEDGRTLHLRGERGMSPGLRDIPRSPRRCNVRPSSERRWRLAISWPVTRVSASTAVRSTSSTSRVRLTVAATVWRISRCSWTAGRTSGRRRPDEGLIAPYSIL